MARAYQLIQLMDNSTSETDSLKVRARQNVVLCILALLFNSLLLIVVCISARLRKSAKYQLIASLSVADVLLGAVYLPLDTSMAFSGGVWKYRLAVRTIIAHSEDVYLTHEITDTVLACFISIAFNVPFLVELVMHVQCDGFSTCASPRRVQHVLEVLRTAESVSRNNTPPTHPVLAGPLQLGPRHSGFLHFCVDTHMEFARSNTDVRLAFQEKLKRKSGAFFASDGDIISNDYSLKQVLRKKRGEATLYGGMPLRKPVRTLSEERLNEEVSNIMTYASLNTFHESVETIGEHGVTELADEAMCPPSEDEEEVNSNHTTRPCRSDPQEHLRYHVQSYPSLFTCDVWREAGAIKSDTSSSGHSKGSMDTLAPVCEDV
nr:hypothetical protein BaRGS_010906 [Batillaria attramentaria]